MPPYRIAVFYEAVQLSDIVGIDLFGNCSQAYINFASQSFPIPPHISSQAIDMEFLYVSSSLDPAQTTPDVKIVPTHTYETCPRDVDVVLVGGPLLSHRPEASLQFFKDIFGGKGKEGVVFMTTCVGSLWVADSGVLKGKKATTNRMALEIARKLHPDVEWVDRRWVSDEMDAERGEIWTAGGAGCGIDMIAQFLEERFRHPLSIHARMGVDFDPHLLGQDYKTAIEEGFAALAPKN